MRYRFGGFELDTDRLALSDPAGDEIHVEPRVFDVLRFLLENRQRTVTKQELVDGAWAGAFVSDSAVKRAVFEVRRVLRDHGADPGMVRTVHGRGYRFDEPVEIASGEQAGGEPVPTGEDPAGAVGALPEASTEAAPRPRPWTRSAVSIVAALALTALVTWRVLAPDRDAVGPAPLAPPFLAVFSLDNLGPPETAPFADGLSEEIAARLTRLEGLDVLSRTSALQYDRSGRTLADIHADLGVTWVLDGSVRWQAAPEGGGRVRVTPQLSSVAGDRVLWTTTFDRPVTEILAIQDEIADEVARQLGGLVASRHSAVDETVDPDAYRAFLSAQAHAGFFTERAALAASLYRRAVELDPGFTRAWAGLAIAEATVFHRGVDRSGEVAERARQAAARALELDPGAAEAHRANGYLHYWLDHDYPSALAAFHRAAELGGADADTAADEAYVLRRLGRFDQALAGLRRAARLDPLSGARRLVIADTLMYVRRYDEADREYQQAIALAPDLPLAHALRAQNVLLWHGDVPAATALLDRMPATDDEWALLYRASFLLAAGRPHDLLALCRERGNRVIQVEYGAVPVAELEARALEMAGDPTAARAAWRRAASILSRALSERPDDGRLLTARSLAHAALGECDAPSRRRAAKARPAAEDAFLQGTQAAVSQAEISLRCGETEAAIRRLADLLEVPSWVTPALLAIDPAWIPLRDEPAFRALLSQQPPAAPAAAAEPHDPGPS